MYTCTEIEIKLTSSFILILEQLSATLPSSGPPDSALSLLSTLSSVCFLFVPTNEVTAELFSLETGFFCSALGFRVLLCLGFWDTLGSLGTFGLAVLLAAAFFVPAAVFLVVLLEGFGSGGLHSSASSSSLLDAWQKDLMEKQKNKMGN